MNQLRAEPMTTDSQIRYVTIDGIRIRCRDQGGPGLPVLLSHGIGGSLELWDRQFDGGLPGLRLIAWDAPNHGMSDLTHRTEDFDSYAAWALKLADALGLEAFIAAGNSMGAAVSLRMAGLASDRVAGLVLANAAALGPEVTPVFRLFSLPFLGEVMTKPSDKGVDLQIKSIVKNISCITPDLRTVIRRNTFKPGGTAAFLATLRSMTGVMGQRKAGWQKSHAQLAALTCPVLIIHGREDAVLPAKHSQAAARLTPLAQLLILEDCGHTPQVEAPEVFNAALADFASGLSAPPPR
jgi:2-hydroxy-6-oxonona-2,4-dienedioate hydrolase